MEEDANQNPAALPPPTPDDEIGVGHSGLHNVSNTCYLNATVQVRAEREMFLSLFRENHFFHFCSLGASEVQMDEDNTPRFFLLLLLFLSLCSRGTRTRKTKPRFIEKTRSNHSLFPFLCVCLTPAGVVRFGTVPSVFTERRMRTTVGGTPDARAKEKVSTPTRSTKTGQCERSREAAEICFIEEEEEE